MPSQVLPDLPQAPTRAGHPPRAHVLELEGDEGAAPDRDEQIGAAVVAGPIADIHVRMRSLERVPRVRPPVIVSGVKVRRIDVAGHGVYVTDPELFHGPPRRPRSEQSLDDVLVSLSTGWLPALSPALAHRVLRDSDRSLARHDPRQPVSEASSQRHGSNSSRHGAEHSTRAVRSDPRRTPSEHSLYRRVPIRLFGGGALDLQRRAGRGPVNYVCLSWTTSTRTPNRLRSTAWLRSWLVVNLSRGPLTSANQNSEASG